MRNTRNQLIKQYAKDRNVGLWELADRLGISDSWLSRLLRRDLGQERLDQWKNIIDDIANSRI